MKIQWLFTAVIVMLIFLLMEVPGLKRLRSRRDVYVFYSLWGIALAAVVAQIMGWPLPKPFDWIRAIFGPLNRLSS